ncbi:hypothetical protein [Alteromonas macleodii]|uniref:DUF4365 domain-containing protein n=1 Tax=Alteromonas macleodii TaxID=28108 RepID=A0AB36FW73_ALTMA|nr:hypothetical protein [Alteromonas macleodii]OES29618.1 hypothetical protein BFV93_2992 [Alteromonas macleodii]OES30157.1 hypothetical protein BFV94_3004 [Alteromonas macleodii]OES30314.1 hypothetical protein BFV95_3004 [Alteromonas macleodii]OES40701.1 hypothetical protein BFV96_2989 [Alteromonas macleodii]
MRDLGLMGESTFSLWCAEVGLIPNGSQIDRTGWDFFVEFPFESSLSPQEIHKSAFECKVQVKATDKNDRKLSITLSNLRRLITAQMPAFFVFIEFDEKEMAQNAFVVHVDNELILKVLKRLHEIEQSDKDNNFNKRKMTIHYDDSNLLEQSNGDSLKNYFLRHIGDDVSKYIMNKKSHLESTGYEDGFAQITFTTEGEQNLKSLIDVSLGIEKNVQIAKFKGFDTRFGILSNNPSFDSDGGKLAMPNLKPTAKGKIRFKEDRLSAGISFECKLYISPFNQMVPDDLKKMRIEGEFFDLKFNPHTGAASYSFSFGEDIRLEVKKFRNAIRLLNLLSTSGKKVVAELLFEDFPKLEFEVGCNDQEFDFSSELKALNSAVKIIEDFDVTDFIDISLDEISRYETHICQMEGVLDSSPNFFKVEFGVDGDGYDPSKETTCIFLVTTPIGSQTFGVILVITGNVEEIENDRYRLVTKNAVIEQRIISEKDESIPNSDLVNAIESIEKQYDSEFSVVTMFDKSVNKGIKPDS